MKKLGSMVASLLVSALATSSAYANPSAATDSFYTYTGSTPLSAIPLGTVVKQRTVTYHIAGVPTAVTALQLLYRTNNSQKQAVVNVTSIIKSPVSNGRAISYQSAYDSLNPYDSPSRVIAGDRDITKFINPGTLVYSAESIPLAAMLKAGYNIIVPDTEGMTANFAAGPEYGMTTLDSVRAALNTPATGLSPSSKVALIGYSGGAIATNWAAQLAPSYAPDVNKQLVGASYGGILVAPAHNIHYIDGSIVWGGIAPMALAGIARGYNVDFTPYLSSYGLSVLNDIQNQSVTYILPKYSGLRWRTLLKPQYADINTIPEYVRVANLLNAGLAPSPTIPIQYTQGLLGVLNGTFNPMLGDGVMLAKDARALMKKYCASGIAVKHTEVPLEHATAFGAWVVGVMPWLQDRFAGKTPPSNCWLINQLPSNSLAPETVR